MNPQHPLRAGTHALISGQTLKSQEPVLFINYLRSVPRAEPPSQTGKGRGPGSRQGAGVAAPFGWWAHRGGACTLTLSHAMSLAHLSPSQTYTKPHTIEGLPAYTSEAHKPGTARSLPQLVPYTQYFQHPQMHVPTWTHPPPTSVCGAWSPPCRHLLTLVPCLDDHMPIPPGTHMCPYTQVLHAHDCQRPY